jgi:general secretion pathway protein M
MTINISNISNIINIGNIKLNTREKIIVGVAGAVIVIFLFCQFLVFPLFDKDEQLTRMIATREQQLADIQALQSTYLETSTNTQKTQRQLKTRRKGFTLFSSLETLAGRTGIKSNIAYMKPSTTKQKESNYRLSMVEMKLQEITMSQLLSYLHGIETSRDMIVIKRLSISKSEQKAGLINTIFQVETLEI